MDWNDVFERKLFTDIWYRNWIARSSFIISKIIQIEDDLILYLDFRSNAKLTLWLALLPYLSILTYT
jgi:hypothetical protein